VVVVAAIIVFAVFFSALAVQHHRAFQTNGLDLGNVDQALWNTAQGRFLHFTLMAPVESRLALHVEPVLLLLVPFYWLNWGGPEFLLVVQAVVVALGAWPLYQLSRLKFPAEKNSSFIPSVSLRTSLHPSTFIPVAYLLLPTLESAVLFDFHAITLAPTFLLFAFLALERRQNAVFALFALLAMACKEDMPLVAAMLGLYAGLSQRRWRLAIVTITIGAAWFALAVLLIQPQFAAGGNIQLDRYAWLGDSFPAMLQTLVTQPGLVVDHLWHQVDLPGYLARLFFPTAFLALFSPLTLLPALPVLAVNLLSDNPFSWRLEDFHYGAPLAPFLFISAIYGLKRISDWASERVGESASERVSESASQRVSESASRRVGGLANGESPLLPREDLCSFAASLWGRSPAPLFITILSLLLLIFSAVYHFHRGYTPLARPFQWPQVTPHHRRLEAYLAAIPPKAVVFAQSNLAPHLTHRPAIYTNFAYFTDPAYPAQPVTDIFLDITAFENIGGLHQVLRQTLLESGAYRLVSATDGILHLKPLTVDRRPPSAEILPPPPTSLLPSPFYTFTRPDTPPQYTLSVDFGGMLRLRGYSLHFNRQEEVQVSLDLEPLQPLAGIQPVLYLLDETGEPVGATVDWQPGLVWYPPEQWPLGQTVQVRFNTFPWHTRATPAYRLALGVVLGDDVWQGKRLRPHMEKTGPLAPRLPAAGALLELARFEQVWDMPLGGPVVRQFRAKPLPIPLAANFNHQINLQGAGFKWQMAAKRGKWQTANGKSSIALTLAWQALAASPNLTRFVQLVGPSGQVYSQNDAPPDNGQYPTSLWQPDEVVVETVTLPLPADLPPGHYTLHVGLYHPATGVRLPLVSGGDHVEIEAGCLGD
jgi:uncharacterized membrane protein